MVSTDVILLLLILNGIEHVDALTRRQYSSCCAAFPDSSLCGCENGVIQCHDLPSTPVVHGSRMCRIVDIRDSTFTLAPNDFANIQTEELRLNNNHLNDSSIDPRAFDRLRNTLKVLHLANNSLTKVPEALRDLENITTLDLSGNPIPASGFDEETMRTIGDSLTDFRMGSQVLNAWPATLKHLQMLQNLTITESNFTLLPVEAFHGFKGTLKELTMAHTKLSSVPLAIASLRYLEVLNFDDNVRVGDYGMNVPIVPGLMPYLYNISLQRDNITTFPGVLGAFIKLKNVQMDRNNLKFVSDESAGAVHQVNRLSLQNSGLTRIPEALQNISGLVELDLSKNLIHSVEGKDLMLLTSLKKLKMNNNPILYLARDTFAKNENLTHIEMRRTNITKIPCAVKDLFKTSAVSKSVVLDLQFNKIECTCSLQWLYEVIRNNGRVNFKVEGRCETIEKSIQEYITNDLPDCPSGATCA